MYRRLAEAEKGVQAHLWARPRLRYGGAESGFIEMAFVQSTMAARGRLSFSRHLRVQHKYEETGHDVYMRALV